MKFVHICFKSFNCGCINLSMPEKMTIITVSYRVFDNQFCAGQQGTNSSIEHHAKRTCVDTGAGALSYTLKLQEFGLKDTKAQVLGFVVDTAAHRLEAQARSDAFGNPGQSGSSGHFDLLFDVLTVYFHGVVFFI